MKTINKQILIVSVLTTITFGPVSMARCDTPIGGPALTAELDESEAATLTFIREEEKMARDVYLAMSTQWGLPIFAQIAESEQEHMDAIERLLDKYGLPDPVLGIGTFADPLIQELYDSLMESGSTSVLGALMAGAYIEEFDIHDLASAIAATDNPDLQRVYSNLEAGSENHLRAFVAEIEASGVDYTAQYLDQSVVDEILAATTESGQREQNRRTLTNSRTNCR